MYSKFHKKTDFLTYYMQRISNAAVITDARCIVRAGREYQKRALAPLTPTGDAEPAPPSPRSCQIA